MVLLGVFSLFFAWQLKQTYAYGFAAVCGVCFLVSCYPVFFSYGTWPVRPWYVLEVVCLMGVYPLIARIQGKIVKLPQRLIRVETVILSGGMVLAGVFFMFGAGNARFGQIYALLLFLYKTGCALCLLYQAFLSVPQRGVQDAGSACGDSVVWCIFGGRPDVSGL